jgi:hypothetical protein
MPIVPIGGTPERNSEHAVREPLGFSPERRASIRFALRVEVGFTVSDRGVPVKTGKGRTIDLSSSGLSFTTDRPLLTGQRLKASIDWPVSLGGAAKMRLVLSGVVVRADSAVIAVRIERYEFRTRRVGPNTGSPDG